MTNQSGARVSTNRSHSPGMQRATVALTVYQTGAFISHSFLQRRSVERRKNTSVFRDDVTEATPGDKGVTYIQVRVID